jgi:DNA-directed RNA polymerase subunit RPC12/RpoP
MENREIGQDRGSGLAVYAWKECLGCGERYVEFVHNCFTLRNEKTKYTFCPHCGIKFN